MHFHSEVRGHTDKKGYAGRESKQLLLFRIGNFSALGNPLPPGGGSRKVAKATTNCQSKNIFMLTTLTINIKYVKIYITH